MDRPSTSRLTLSHSVEPNSLRQEGTQPRRRALPRRTRIPLPSFLIGPSEGLEHHAPGTMFTPEVEDDVEGSSTTDGKRKNKERPTTPAPNNLRTKRSSSSRSSPPRLVPALVVLAGLATSAVRGIEASPLAQARRTMAPTTSLSSSMRKGKGRAFDPDPEPSWSTESSRVRRGLESRGMGSGSGSGSGSDIYPRSLPRSQIERVIREREDVPDGFPDHYEWVDEIGWVRTDERDLDGKRGSDSSDGDHHSQNPTAPSASGLKTVSFAANPVKEDTSPSTSSLYSTASATSKYLELDLESTSATPTESASSTATGSETSTHSSSVSASATSSASISLPTGWRPTSNDRSVFYVAVPIVAALSTILAIVIIFVIFTSVAWRKKKRALRNKGEGSEGLLERANGVDPPAGGGGSEKGGKLGKMKRRLAGAGRRRWKRKGNRAPTTRAVGADRPNSPDRGDDDGDGVRDGTGSAVVSRVDVTGREEVDGPGEVRRRRSRSRLEEDGDGESIVSSSEGGRRRSSESSRPDTASTLSRDRDRDRPPSLRRQATMSSIRSAISSSDLNRSIPMEQADNMVLAELGRNRSSSRASSFFDMSFASQINLPQPSPPAYRPSSVVMQSPIRNSTVIMQSQLLERRPSYTGRPRNFNPVDSKLPVGGSNLSQEVSPSEFGATNPCEPQNQILARGEDDPGLTIMRGHIATDDKSFLRMRREMASRPEDQDGEDDGIEASPSHQEPSAPVIDDPEEGVFEAIPEHLLENTASSSSPSSSSHAGSSSGTNSGSNSTRTTSANSIGLLPLPPRPFVPSSLHTLAPSPLSSDTSYSGLLQPVPDPFDAPEDQSGPTSSPMPPSSKEVEALRESSEVARRMREQTLWELSVVPSGPSDMAAVMGTIDDEEEARPGPSSPPTSIPSTRTTTRTRRTSQSLDLPSAPMWLPVYEQVPSAPQLESTVLMAASAPPEYPPQTSSSSSSSR